MPLTDVAIRRAKPADKPQKLSDAGGLYLYITMAGAKSWRWKYRFGGKEKVLALGLYPDVSLANARDARDDARRLLRGGVDPGEQKKAAATAAVVDAASGFEAIAREWLATRPWVPTYSRKVEAWFERFGRFGGQQPGQGGAKAQLWLEPDRTPALGIALALGETGRPFVLGLPHLPGIELHTHPTVLGWGNLVDLPTAPPQHPVVTQLDPGSGNGGGAEALVAVHGKHARKDTTGRRRSCERGGDLAESLGEGIVKPCIAYLTKSSICPNRRVEPDSTLCRRGAAQAPPG
jgi:hypothetical protein